MKAKNGNGIVQEKARKSSRLNDSQASLEQKKISIDATSLHKITWVAGILFVIGVMTFCFWLYSPS